MFNSHQTFLKKAREPLLPGIERRLSVEQIAELARKRRRVQILTVLLSLFVALLVALFLLIFLPQRLGMLSRHGADKGIVGQGQLLFLLLGAFGAGALLTHMISRLLGMRVDAAIAAARRAESESLESGGAVNFPTT